MRDEDERRLGQLVSQIYISARKSDLHNGYRVMINQPILLIGVGLNTQ